MTNDEKETFDSFYQKDQLSFGDNPTREIVQFVDSTKAVGFALDIGSGDGRNALFLARSGFYVTALDFSKVGSEKLARFSQQKGLGEKVHAICIDARQWEYPAAAFDLVIAVTLFDHLRAQDIMPLFDKVCRSLKKGGALFIKVHTIDDPGYRETNRPASELAPMIHHYFEHNELLRMPGDGFRILLYEERTEEDRTHGQIHSHGFAQVLALKLY
jgi:cyclopropane fatty-acyl-phospholipid synthase-like methyltransferase